MKTVNANDLVPCRMNRASITFEDINNGEVYFATRKMSNRIFMAKKGLFAPEFLVMMKIDPKTNKASLWLATPSIF